MYIYFYDFIDYIVYFVFIKLCFIMQWALEYLIF